MEYEAKVEGTVITITIPVIFAKGTTEEQKELFVKGAKMWEGEYGDYSVVMNVEERDNGKRNKIKFSEKNADDSHVSYVFASKYMKLFNEETVEENLWVISHEVGHLMELDDQYVELKKVEGKRRTEVKEGWEDNIMAERWGKPDSRNIGEVVKKPKTEEGEKSE